MSQEVTNPGYDGTAICNRCGAVMDRKMDPDGGSDIYVCPSCGWEIDEMEYEYEQDDKEWVPVVFKSYKGNVPPVGCRACGGPYPYCKTSCGVFDD